MSTLTQGRDTPTAWNSAWHNTPREDYRAKWIRKGK